MRKILVSGCLLGKECAYDGKARYSSAVAGLCAVCDSVGICPEVEGDLPCPRKAHEIEGGDGFDVLDGKARVILRSGQDNTANFVRGAYAALEKARAYEIKLAIFKSHSPSCGKHYIHDGGFSGGMRPGCGVTTELFMRNGIMVFTEDEIEAAMLEVERQQEG